MSDSGGAIEEIGRQRAALARRIQLPWWYVALFAVAVAALLSAPAVMEGVSATFGEWGVLLPAVVVLLLLDRLLGAATGVRLTRRTLWAYPSSRPAGITMIVAVAGGVAGEYLLLPAHQLPLLVLVVAVVTGLAVRCLLWQTAGIRRDVMRGRAASA